ncbi:flagellin [Veronia pacifica]|uniref:Flagellin n=1 Tax=Veronia pacifica TaxID=1080227 RepID=A0A1C3E7J1_9GAMM|nr:flagellin [Veronia pacifica]ODA29193.1 flagellin [Veronia pacifica]
MSFSILTNMSSMRAYRFLHRTNGMLNTAMERLASGQRINSAKDDAAGLQIANRLNSHIRGMDVGMRNANDGMSMSQVAEGAMQEATNMLFRMRDLALQSSNGSNSAKERESMQEEISALKDEINRIAETTSFAGKKLLNGTFGSAAIQFGAEAGEAVVMSLDSLRTDNSELGGRLVTGSSAKSAGWTVSAGNTTLLIDFVSRSGKTVDMTINANVGDDIEEVATLINGYADGNLSASVDEDGKLRLFMPDADMATFTVSGGLEDDLSLNGPMPGGGVISESKILNDLDISTIGGAQLGVGIIDAALEHIDSERAKSGAFQNRLGHIINNLSTTQENLSASYSRIIDTDFARESVNFTKAQILEQVGTSVLVQAKSLPINLLSLLR